MKSYTIKNGRIIGKTFTPEQLEDIVYSHELWVVFGDRAGKQADFSNADLRDADLSGWDLSHAIFANADLRGADLSMCDLSDADFNGACLHNVNMYHTTVIRHQLAAASLDGAKMKYAYIEDEEI